MADDQVTIVDISDQSRVIQKAFDIGDGYHALAVSNVPSKAIWAPSLAVGTAAFAAGDVLIAESVDTGVASETGYMKLQSINATENGGQAPALTIIFFNAEPGQSAAQNAAVTWDSGDCALFAGMVRIASGDWYTVGGKSFLTLGNAAAGIISVAGDNLFAVIICDNAYDPVATGDLGIKCVFEGVS